MESSLQPSAELLLEHARFVRALARELLRDEHAAEDLVQDAYLRALRRPPRRSSAVRAWLRAVTARLSIEGLRARARGAAREERVARPEALPSVAEELAHTEVLRGVAGAVLALDEPYRTTVLLAYWRGWDAHRIAAETGTPLATVRSRLQRAHARLRERLDREHGRETWAVALASLPAVEGGAGVLVWAGAGLVLLAALLLVRPWSARGPLPTPAPAAGLQARAQQEPADVLRAAPDGGGRSAIATPAAGKLRISGTVVERACEELGLVARPAAGLALAVRLSESPWGSPPRAQGEARTDEAGRFALELADPGQAELHVFVSAPADATYRRTWRREELHRPGAELALERVPHGVLHGTVIDERGAALGGIALTVAGAPVTSSPEGTFALAGAASAEPVELASLGWALLGCEPARALEEGGYTPLVVRLGPAASLRVKVVDLSGAGLAGADVSAALAPSELALLALDGEAPARRAASDEQGYALLEGLWAERKLALVLALPDELRTFEARSGTHLLVSDEAGAGRPIVVARGERLELEARLGAERDVAGTVLLEGGEPVARAEIEVADLGAGTEQGRPVLLTLRSDEAGRFAGRLRAFELVGPLRITASAPELAPRDPRNQLGELGYAGPRTEPEQRSIVAPAAEVERAADDVAGLTALALVLEPRVAIRGTLLGRDGAPVARLGMGGCRLWAARAGSAYHGSGVQARGVRGRPGGFEIPGLAPGAYDLYASEELEGFYTFENFLQRFPGVAAGGADVELRLGTRHEARVQVRIDGGEPGSTVVLHRRLFARGDLAGQRAPRELRVSGAQGWPAGTVFGFTGIGGHALDEGRTSDGYDEFEGREHALQPLEPGWYELGVQADGFFPQATGLLWLDEGEYAVEFELVPAATLRGRVRADAGEEFLAVMLVDERGGAVPVSARDGYGERATVVDTAASGEFVLRRAPAGAFRLRAGTRAELARGAFRSELALELRPGENARVELR